MTDVPPDELFEAPEPWPYDPALDASERLADAMGDPTHPIHEEHYEAEEEAFTRRFERERLSRPPVTAGVGKPLPS